MRRVVITGAGCITAMGHDLAAFSRNLFDGVSGIRPIEGVPEGSLHFVNAATVIGFVPADWLLASQVLLAERSSQFALAAARQALSASCLMGQYTGEDVAVVFGCSAGGRTAEEPETAKLYTRGARVHPMTVPRAMASAGTSLVCMEHGITGPAYTVSTACASSAHAIGQAFHMVRSGMVEAAVAGGHEAPLTYGFLKGWDSLHVVSATRCRPFAADRDGMTLGEGAAVFALEAMDAAVERGAPILAEIVGFGMSSDASHMTLPDPQGSAAAMRRALKDAGMSPHEVGYINAHGTGTVANDRAEAEAIQLVFEESAQTLAVSSTKSLHGHTLGAAGAIELLATALALQRGMLPAAGGVARVDETLKLDGVLQENRASDASIALCNSFAFGGLNAVLALRRYVVVCVAALLLCASLGAQESGVLGYWTEPQGSVIHIERCGEHVCATLVEISSSAPARVDGKNPDPGLRRRSLCGVRIGEGFHSSMPTQAEGGTLYDPKSGKTYRASMSVHGAQLDLRGYIGLPLFGRTERWRRTETTATCLR